MDPSRIVVTESYNIAVNAEDEQTSNRAARRAAAAAAAHAARRVTNSTDTAALSPRAVARKGFAADPGRASHWRAILDKAYDRKGEEHGMREAVSMLLAVFAFLVGRRGIEITAKMMQGALQDMIGQAVIKRADDIRAGRWPPMNAEIEGDDA